jgi:5'-deoxynucleotidase YfbR-like HD superfamily hydrolase
MIDLNVFLSSPLRKLSSVLRYSGLPVSHTESVAEHTYWVSCFAWFFATDWEMENKGKLDASFWRDLYSRVCFHDVEECVTGDFPTPFKYSNEALKKALDHAGEIACTALVGEIVSTIYPSEENYWRRQALQDALYGAWYNAKESSPVGTIVAMADAFSVVFYVNEEVQRGNRQILNELGALERSISRLLDRILVSGELDEDPFRQWAMESCKCIGYTMTMIRRRAS